MRGIFQNLNIDGKENEIGNAVEVLPRRRKASMLDLRGLVLPSQ